LRTSDRYRTGKSSNGDGGLNVMHVLFVHKEFPGHFGHIARYLAGHHGVECSFVYRNLPNRFQGQLPPGIDKGIRLIQYQSRGASRDTHYCSLHAEISMWHAQAVYETMKGFPAIKPDVVIGHCGFGTAVFLADLYPCPLIVHCEYFERPGEPYLFSRREFPPSELDVLRARASNATNLVNLHTCAAGYSPTEWQRSLFPAEYQHKLVTIFDGIDRSLWQRRSVSRTIGTLPPIPAGTRVVTYVSYGLEALRGFDIFMKVAKRICEARPDVIFIIVGADRVQYGEDVRFIQAPTFAQHVLSQDSYDLSRFLFTGQILEEQLVQILSLSDVHIYLTMPFVLGWSLFDALACSCTVVASDTAPVREVIRHEQNGLLADFYDVDGLARLAMQVLDDPKKYRPLGQAGTRLVDEKYSLARTASKMLDLFERVVKGKSPGVPN
jgi:glycosyltransferase involved in cell wall biosynthesis